MHGQGTIEWYVNDRVVQSANSPMRNPRLRSGLHACVLDADHVVMLGAGVHLVIEGRLHALLMPYIDGRHSLEQIARRCAGEVTGTDVAFAVEWLADEGLLAAAPSPSSRTLQTTVRNGIRVIETRDYLSLELAAIAAEVTTPWIPVRPDESHFWIGPLIDPPRTICWSCVCARLSSNQPWRSALPAAHELPAHDQFRVSESSALCRRGFARLHDLVARGGAASVDRDCIQSLNRGGSDWVAHFVMPDPKCPTCSGKLPARVSSASHTVWRDGGWRTATAEATYTRLRPLVSPLTGCITRLERRRSSASFCVYTADHLFPVPRSPQELLKSAGRSQSAGKGLTHAQARVSAMAEALERYSGVFRGDEPRRRSTMFELGDAAIHPNAIANFSDRQFATRATWNTLGNDRQRVPERFDPSWSVEWTQVRSLTHEQPRFLPTASCYYGYSDEKGRQFAFRLKFPTPNLSKPIASIEIGSICSAECSHVIT